MTKQEEIALQNLMTGNLEISLKQIKNKYLTLIGKITLMQSPEENSQLAGLMGDLYKAGAVDAIKVLAPNLEDKINDKIGRN